MPGGEDTFGPYFLLNSPKNGTSERLYFKAVRFGHPLKVDGAVPSHPTMESCSKSIEFSLFALKRDKAKCIFWVFLGFFPLFFFAGTRSAAYGRLTSVVVGCTPPDGSSCCHRCSINHSRVVFFTGLSSPCSKKKKEFLSRPVLLSLLSALKVVLARLC